MILCRRRKLSPRRRVQREMLTRLHYRCDYTKHRKKSAGDRTSPCVMYASPPSMMVDAITCHFDVDRAMHLTPKIGDNTVVARSPAFSGTSYLAFFVIKRQCRYFSQRLK